MISRTASNAGGSLFMNALINISLISIALTHFSSIHIALSHVD
ncbi:hypothetical protein XBP1_3010047 [Xenorhabdus bovienii str. puntauvense]|uniref:Uncharacterized protein n=4 Tax=Xenorhabdus bovienii TaxID=40576 RepID=A0A077QLX8_XENBV|nr:hypothetical protein XBFFL1_1190033 [Xenorhabdus bovienii str. feltiae Florida]CDG98398.1 hypothetical protein XBP1_3010047 [Xenorhabdus bovienii str. puntauvense]CDH00709.1 hypothetical protein XBFM1_1740072 [Xenorhabdus bovienii str. feltiae Moldova]CDH34303.1 hypothetical protein XBI1_3010072 [Xenorhabdus bovienii str. Intermedium]CDM90505.1 protein of unknown function [Xenorhabdus bovienii]